jgi:putative ABC transport system permease protein
MKTLPPIAAFGQDVRHALRALRRDPAFTLPAIVALAFGIAAATTIFGIADGVALRPLPYDEPDALIRIWEVETSRPQDRMGVSPPTFLDLRAGARSLAAVAAVSGARPVLTGLGDAVQLDAAIATADLATVLGVAPALGRWYDDAEERAAAPVVVVSHRLWAERLSADPAAIGRTVTLDGSGRTIIGVMPADFDYPEGAQLWLPLLPDLAGALDVRGARFLDVTARLAAGRTLADARVDLGRVSARLAERSDMAEYGFAAEPLGDVLLGAARPRMLALLAAVALLLAIACANVGGLLLARAAGRDRELALRRALGAGRPRLTAQLFTEALVLWAIGATLGVLLAAIALPVLAAWTPLALPRIDHVALDARVIAFAGIVSLATGLLFGLLPALAATHDAAALRAGPARASASRAQTRLRSALVVAELAVSVVLLVGAALFARSLLVLGAVDHGFTPDGATAVRIALPGHRYPAGAAQADAWQRIGLAFTSIPGVDHVGGSSNPPVDGTSMQSPVRIEGRTDGAAGDPVQVAAVLPGYFDALAIDVRDGRSITAADQAASAPVALVNEAFARRYFPGESAIGRRVRTFFGTDWREIVGVVADVRHRGPAEPVPPQLFIPSAQHPTAAMTFLLRAGTDVSAAAIRDRVRELDDELPIERIAPMTDLVSATVALPRFLATLIAAFAAAALALAALGIYSLLSYAVTRRAAEIGTRIALGARPRDIVRLVLANAAALTCAGLFLGLAAALAVSRFLASMLFGIRPLDPASLGLAAAVLALVALAASAIPARRASRRDPLTSLRTG